ncbi:MAG: hypothetical protein PHV32_11120 [Eubacteriales bacterium]|nr:hypothetical protein [Eubacteriales bacterium]
MAGFIEEFYYGNIDPQARSFDSDSQYGEAMAILSKNEELLTNQLKDEEKRLFLEYTNA